MNLGKKIIIMSMVTLFIGAGFGTRHAVLAEPPSATFFAANFGTSTYILGIAYEDISKRFYPDLVLSMRETPGLIYNLKKLAQLTPEEKKKTIITAYDGLTWMALHGKGAFKKPLDLKLKRLCAPPALTTFYVTKNPNIKTIEDLEGKTVAIGKKTQLGWGQHPRIYLEDGARLKGKVKIQWLGLKSAISAFKDGLVDAIPAGLYINPINYDFILSPYTEEVVSLGQKVYYLSPGHEAALKRIEKETGLTRSITIPPGKIKFQEKPIVANLGINYYAGTEELQEEIAYHFVKMMLEHVEKIKKYHGLGRLMTRESLAYAMTKENLHPGAYKAFKENGLVD